ncbi:hypothetical protein O181_032978 [Austropuccinia psidii MF-1]|uniref:GPI inositol-deacylase n=1 Tax=Austropuccinia psidii MF-1 TaxID=1389203 RepID=A0A9Q3D0K0_9BASI|nr:hypothetical protein [Austropuccinia psidii MF-1]
MSNQINSLKTLAKISNHPSIYRGPSISSLPKKLKDSCFSSSSKVKLNYHQNFENEGFRLNQSDPPTQSSTLNHQEKPHQTRLQSLLSLGPILFDPIRIPRHPIVLCHGLYGFTVWGPSSFPRFQIHYWGKLLEVLRNKLGVKVIIGKVPATGSIQQRAECLHNLLESQLKFDEKVNLLGHSMGGLDARHLISNFNKKSYQVQSLTTISTPHRGSPFMDWCRANIGVGLTSSNLDQKPRVPFSLKEPLLRPTNEPLSYLPNNLLKLLLLNLVDSPAYSNLSTDFLERVFNPQTPDDPDVQYFSLAGRISKGGLGPLHPLWLPALVMDRLAGPEQDGHDGLVTVASARWGDFLGIVEDTDHWEIRGSSAFGATTGQPDAILNQRAKSNWLEVNRYIGSWLSTSKDSSLISQPDPPDSNSSSIHALANWIVKRLPTGLMDRSQTSTRYKRTVFPEFPLDDIMYFEQNKVDDDNQKFHLESFYRAICKNLYDQGL